MKCVISSFGSSGDFNPCLGLGRELVRRGVEVIFLSNPFHEKQIVEAGMRFWGVGEYFDVFKEIADNPGYLHRRKGPLKVGELVLKTMPELYLAMQELIKEESPDFIACHLLELGGILAAIEGGVPYATITPTPMGWFGRKPPGYLSYTELPLWVRSIQVGCLHWLMRLGFKFSFNPHCRKMGLPEEIGSYHDIFGKSFVNLGLWSETLRGCGFDDPPNSIICGFVRDEHVKGWDDVPEKIAVLFEGEKRPVVVGMGSTASLHGDDIYLAVAEACKRMDWPCLLVGKGLGDFADEEKGIYSVDFAPFGWVFPRAGVIIHHGGVNSTAEALRAGVPSLVVPHAYDQFDNAIRVEKMGAGRRMKVSKVTEDSIGIILDEMLADSQMEQHGQEISKVMTAEADGAEVACESMIQFLDKK